VAAPEPVVWVRSMAGAAARSPSLLAIMENAKDDEGRDALWRRRCSRSDDEAINAACKLGLEGIVFKRKDKAYCSGPCKHWVSVKNPDAPWRKWLEET
jgi:hypothetical protein